VIREDAIADTIEGGLVANPDLAGILNDLYESIRIIADPRGRPYEASQAVNDILDPYAHRLYEESGYHEFEPKPDGVWENFIGVVQDVLDQVEAQNGINS